ncbi:class I histocompatibility antigen, F10 alpha chain-like, partial [Neopelma chrysocephalum]|uniref:class I histocompatibility antigen, F10 alpha chain-like n=1 Tax=Neopelma chrysocephalum TaxID=114329 RepID=UPI000FCD2738
CTNFPGTPKPPSRLSQLSQFPLSLTHGHPQTPQISVSPPVLHSLRYLDVAVTEPSPGIPQFLSMGYVDGIPFVRYDSERDRLEPLTPWMAAGAEPGYWDRQTQIYEWNRFIDADNLEIARGWYNWSGGLHTVQQLSGCDLLSDGSVRRTLRYGIDGRDFISFSPENGTFVAADGAARITQRKWRSDGYEALQHELGQSCVEWLQKYIGYGREALERKGEGDRIPMGMRDLGMWDLGGWN